MTSIGTMAWAAPELKRNFRIGKRENNGQRTVTAKADVFRCSLLSPCIPPEGGGI